MGYEKIISYFRNNRRDLDIVSFVVVSLLGLLSIKLMLDATPYGSGLIGDSYGYISGARTLAAGYGIGRLNAAGNFIPSTHLAPLLSVILAIPEIIGIDAIRAVRWLNALLFGLSVSCSGMIAWFISRNRLTSAATSVLIMSSSYIISAFSWAMSEPLYIFTSLIGLLGLYLFVWKEKNIYLVTGALFVGLAFSARYIGGALLPLGVWFLGLQQGKSLSRRVKEIFLYFIVSVIPMSIWMGYSYINTSQLANRKLDFRPIPGELINDGAKTIWEWFLPIGMYTYRRFTIGLVIIVILISVLMIMKKERLNILYIIFNGNITGLLLSYVVFYLFSLGLSLMFFDHRTPLDQRILSPILIVVLILLASMIEMLWRSSKNNILKLAITVLSIWMLIYNTGLSVNLLQQLRNNGQAYSSLAYQNSHFFTSLKNWPENVTIYTDNMAGVYLVSGKPSYIIPFGQGLDEDGKMYYREIVMEIKKQIGEGKAILAIRDPESIEKDPYIPYDVLVEGLIVTERYSDGEIYAEVIPGWEFEKK